ncbi:PAS domain S-box protein [Pedobacter sp. ASV1-7]|uniref:PAS domain-containing sensor histidine kinase n=1 Tax=Pedobacter sp. ASV1-7 TaxID=3145237 RepID=UPI0032E8A500
MKELTSAEIKLGLYERKIKEMEARIEELTDFIESASIPLHWVDENGYIIWANQAELDALGFTKEEYIGSSITDFHADAQVIEDILTKLTNNETLHNYPARLKCKDGSVKHVLISSNVLRKDGKFIHTRCFTRDITELALEMKRKERLLQELEESDTRIKMAISSTNMGTWEYTPASAGLYLSPEAISIIGFPKDYTVDYASFLKTVHPQDRTWVHQGLNASLNASENETYSAKFKIIRYHDLSERWIHLQGKIISGSVSTDKRFIGTILDITEAMAAEEKNARLIAIIDSSNDAIISMNLEGVITSWNTAAEEIFGFHQEEVAGLPAHFFLPADKQHQAIDLLQQVSRGEKVKQFETRMNTKENGTIDVSITLSPIKDSKGKLIGFSKIVRDITEKKEEEQRKNSFIAMVSHELKTPITAVAAYLQMVLQKAVKEQDSFYISMISRADIKMKKMTTMVQDFLNLTRLEESRLQVTRQQLELLPLIREVVEDGQFLTTRHTLNVIGCEDINVFADREKLGHVLINLLSNAIKYSPQGDYIFIKCEPLNGKVRVSVTDQGVGIKESDQKRIFERFYRVKNQQINAASGFGIGLYLVSEILSQHNSQIQLNSKEGVGSTFFFDLEIV